MKKLIDYFRRRRARAILKEMEEIELFMYDFDMPMEDPE